jgi:hypothetical protein
MACPAAAQDLSLLREGPPLAGGDGGERGGIANTVGPRAAPRRLCIARRRYES